MGILPPIETIARTGVLACWFIYLVSFLLRKRSPAETGVRSGGSPAAGLLIQGCAFFLVWGIQRQSYGQIVPMPEIFYLVLSILALPLAALSLWMLIAAHRELGKQWSVSVRVLSGHELVTTGPYSIVRNPIYTGLLGMMLATGFAVSHWLAIVIAIPVYLIGADIRIHREEVLLHKVFGAEFERYVKKVPSVIPFLRSTPPPAT